MGANVVPGLLNPAEVAGGRLKDVRIYYSRQSGPTKRKHMAAHRKRLEGTVEVISAREPQVHAKVSHMGLQRRGRQYDELGVPIRV